MCDKWLYEMQEELKRLSARVAALEAEQPARIQAYLATLSSKERWALIRQEVKVERKG